MEQRPRAEWPSKPQGHERSVTTTNLGLARKGHLDSDKVQSFKHVDAKLAVTWSVCQERQYLATFCNRVEMPRLGPVRPVDGGEHCRVPRDRISSRAS